MKVLLYEHGRQGHKITNRDYVCRSLTERKIEYELIHDDDSPPDPPDRLREVCTEAHQRKCDLIHVLTLDGLKKHLVRLALSPRSHLPIVANYYLYSSLFEFPRNMGIRFLLARRVPDVLLVMDEFLAERPVSRRLRDRLCYVPDPWDPADSPVVPRAEARLRLAISTSEPAVLLFGDLSERKGVLLLLEAAQRAGPAAPVIILAGQPNLEPPQRARFDELIHALGPTRVIARLERVPETQVGTYFQAADFVVCAFPSWVKVSSGTFTRSCAAQRPVICTAHGNSGRLTRERKLGLLFETENVDDLARALREARRCFGTEAYHQMARNGWSLATASTVDRYGACVVSSYHQALRRYAA